MMNLYYIMHIKYLYKYQIIKKQKLVYFINKTKIINNILKYLIKILIINNNKKYLLYNYDYNYVYQFQIKNKQKLYNNII